MRRTLAPLLLVTTALALAGPAPVPAAPGATTLCAPSTLGPGALRRGPGSGPACLLGAYRAGCRAATFTLSVFGVDTIERLRFALERAGVGCQVAVSDSFTVVPRAASLHDGVCSSLSRRGGGIVAGGCRGQGIPSELSLTAPG